MSEWLRSFFQRVPAHIHVSHNGTTSIKPWAMRKIIEKWLAAREEGAAK